MNLRQIEKKVLGAMLILSDANMVVKAPVLKIAQTMGYKAQGGALTFAIDSLEYKNHINKIDKGVYKVTL